MALSEIVPDGERVLRKAGAGQPQL
jgi:hypothetical protein